MAAPLVETRRYVCWLWLISALPAGAAIWVLPAEGMLVLWSVAVILDNAHRLVPIATAWTHPEFRQVMARRRWKTLALPIGLLCFATSIGVATSLGWTTFIFAKGQQFQITDWRNPYPLLLWTAWIWNGYHFGMQNFGVVSLLRARRNQWQRTCDMTWCVWLTVAAFLLAPIATSFNHWIVELGLCGRVIWKRYARFAIIAFVVLVFGALHFYWWTPTSHGVVHYWQGSMMYVMPTLICFTAGLSFWHFLQDRWMWQFGDPQVRATIGKELFA